MRYKEMIEKARRDGVANEAKMWKSVEAIEEMLEEMDDDVMMWRFMRRQHEILYGEHYCELFAQHDIDEMSYTDRNGVKQTGGRWTLNETKDAVRGMKLPAGVNDYDVWVALNATYADLCRVIDDDVTLVKVGVAFWFEDEDWPGKAEKVWQYARAREWYDRI